MLGVNLGNYALSHWESLGTS